LTTDCAIFADLGCHRITAKPQVRAMIMSLRARSDTP
jgi:hypothetical protein